MEVEPVINSRNLSKIKDNSSRMELLGRLDNQEFDTGSHFFYFISVKFSFDNLIEAFKHAVTFFQDFDSRTKNKKLFLWISLKKVKTSIETLIEQIR